MKTTKIALFTSIALLICGLTVCIPGICGCVVMIPGVDGDRFGFLPFIADALGLIGILGSLIVMTVIKTRKVVKNGS